MAKIKKHKLMSSLNCCLEKYHIILIYVVMIIYKLSLEVFYVFKISPLYSREGLTFNGYTLNYFLSWIGFLFLLKIMPKNKKGISNIFLQLQFILTIIPMITYYGFTTNSLIYFCMIISVITIETFLLAKNKKNHSTITFSTNKKILTIFFMGMIICVYFFVLAYSGFHGLKAFDLSYLYEIRKGIKYPTILSYLSGWVLSAIIPFFILYFMEKKRYIRVAILIIFMILFYMSMGNKSIYLSTAVLLIAYVLCKCKQLTLGICSGISIVCIAITCADFIPTPTIIQRGADLGAAIIGERFLFAPSANKFIYYDCFTDLPKVGFSEGLIGKAFGLTYPYKGSMGQTAYAYFNKGQLFRSNSNTGYLGDSYGQAGFIGMIVTAFLLCQFLKLLEIIGANWSETVMLPLTLLLVILLNDSAFISIFFSAGWGITVLLLILFNKPKGITVKRSDL